MSMIIPGNGCDPEIEFPLRERPCGLLKPKFDRLSIKILFIVLLFTIFFLNTIWLGEYP